jgi:large subunit ribosomal protein L25
MERVNMEAEFREVSGKGAARQIRRSGQIPAVLYGEGKATSLVMNPAHLVKLLQSESGENALVNLTIKKPGGKEAQATAILRDFQMDPVSRKILHADLFEVSMNKMLRLRIPVEETGNAPGVKEGGILQHNLREIEIECLPANIPDQIEVDISALGIGESIHVRDLVVGEGVKMLEEPDQTVISVAAPISDEKLESLLTTGPAEGAEAEPEVVAKGKEQAEEEGAEGKPADKKSAEKKPSEKKEEKE